MSYDPIERWEWEGDFVPTEWQERRAGAQAAPSDLPVGDAPDLGPGPAASVDDDRRADGREMGEAGTSSEAWKAMPRLK